jgi:hypothetical protein
MNEQQNSQQQSASAHPTPMSDAEVLDAYRSQICAACKGPKPRENSFCLTDILALTIFVRRSLSLGPEDAQFCDVWRAALRHLQLNTVRKEKYPSHGSTWRFQSHEDLHDAGYRFVAHALCNVPVPERQPLRCGQRIVCYRSPVGDYMVRVNLKDYQPHRTTCVDPDYWKRRAAEKKAAQTSARKRKRTR